MPDLIEHFSARDRQATLQLIQEFLKVRFHAPPKYVALIQDALVLACDVAIEKLVGTEITPQTFISNGRAFLVREAAKFRNKVVVSNALKKITFDTSAPDTEENPPNQGLAASSTRYSRSTPHRRRRLVRSSPVVETSSEPLEAGALYFLTLPENVETQIAEVASNLSNPGLAKQVNKALKLLEQNPHHPGLNSHRMWRLGSNRRIWTSYAQDGYRILWTFGERRGEIVVHAVIPHY